MKTILKWVLGIAFFVAIFAAAVWFVMNHCSKGFAFEVNLVPQTVEPNPSATSSASTNSTVQKVAKVTPPDTELTFETFGTLVWYEGASKDYGHVLFPNKPLVGKDLEKSWHLFAPVFAKYYDLKPILTTPSGRAAWALVPLKESLGVPREVMERYRPQKRAAPPISPKGPRS